MEIDKRIVGEGTEEIDTVVTNDDETVWVSSKASVTVGASSDEKEERVGESQEQVEAKVEQKEDTQKILITDVTIERTEGVSDSFVEEDANEGAQQSGIRAFIQKILHYVFNLFS